ncbi:MAG: DUF1365 family protein [Pseudomonadota bacterium]
MKGQTASSLFEGTVMHHRLRPHDHKMRYKVVSFLFDLDEIDGLAARLKLFSRNGFNLFSFYDRDHADGDGENIRSRIARILQQHGLGDCTARIELLCYPRILGFVFNPLSVYFCYQGDGRLGAILHEVSNTFGDRHSYLIPVTAETTGDNGVVRQHCTKGLYVSPFIGMTADYHFRISPPGKNVAVAIRETDGEGAFFNAAFVGDRVALNDRTLFGAFVRYPLMTLKVIAGIHWEALKLWRKGFAFHKRPEPPRHPVTFVRTATETPKR